MRQEIRFPNRAFENPACFVYSAPWAKKVPGGLVIDLVLGWAGAFGYKNEALLLSQATPRGHGLDPGAKGIATMVYHHGYIPKTAL
jgi:hypothetical protein